MGWAPYNGFRCSCGFPLKPSTKGTYPQTITNPCAKKYRPNRLDCKIWVVYQPVVRSGLFHPSGFVHPQYPFPDSIQFRSFEFFRVPLSNSLFLKVHIFHMWGPPVPWLTNLAQLPPLHLRPAPAVCLQWCPSLCPQQDHKAPLAVCSIFPSVAGARKQIIACANI